MATKLFEILSYKVWMGERIVYDFQEVNFPTPHHDAWISCLGQTGELFEIYFLSEGVVPPENRIRISVSGSHGTYRCRIFVSLDKYVWFIDALRNEKCSAYFDDEYPAQSQIRFSSQAGWGHIDPGQ